MNVIRQTADFSQWLNDLKDLEAKGLIVARIEYARLGNFGDCEPVGDGVSEMRVHFGPGYRIYLIREGLVIYLLLCGGNKASQKGDIKKAKAMARLVKEAATAKVAEEASIKSAANSKGAAKPATAARKKGRR